MFTTAVFVSLSILTDGPRRFAMPLLKDTRKAAERLQEGGVPEEQANAIVDLFVDADEQVVTKGDLDHTEQQLRDDLKHLEQQLRTEMEAMEERLTGRIQQTESRLLRWMIGAVGALAGLLAVFEFLL